MGFKSIYLLPVALFILVPVSFLTTYTIAVLNEHVEPGFPYVSDTGSLPPESCIFGQLLNIAAFMLAVCVYIKYVEVQCLIQSIAAENGISGTFNKATLCVGLTSCVGLDMVANFQDSNVIVVHMLGAFLCFAAGTLYFIFQVWISYKIPELASKPLLAMRIFLVAICVVTTVSTILTGGLASLQRNGSSNPNKWRPDDGGWGLHIASTISEWVLCISYCILVFSFVPEFYNLELEAPVIKFRSHKV